MNAEAECGRRWLVQQSLHSIGSVHGRFQVFHNDHLDYLLAGLAQCEHLLVGITSYLVTSLSQSDTAPHRGQAQNNPLTYFERCGMIRQSLIERGIDVARFTFTPFPIETPTLLPQFIPISIPCLTTVYDDWNREKVRLLREAHYQVVVLWERSEKKMSGSDIRQQIAAGSTEWRQLVPPATVRAVEELDLSSRLRRV